MNTSDLFLYEYNRLDSYLRNLVHGSEKINYISYFEKILPEKKRAECETIRKFKNVIESHSVCPGTKKPIPPIEWVNWLRHALDYCKSNKKTVREALNKELASSTNKHTNTRHVTQSSKNISNYQQLYATPAEIWGHKTSNLSTFGKEIKRQLIIDGKFPANSYDDIVESAVRILENDCDTKDELYLVAHGYAIQTHLQTLESLRKKIAKKQVSSLSIEELNELMKSNN